MEKILTIVIPSYNTSNYIDKTLPTLLGSKNLDLLEIIIVDDGSTDDTATKARIYEQKFPKSVKVLSKTNGGHGSVVNLGIQVATGKYFKVIDGDDYVDTNELDGLVEQLWDTNADCFVNIYTTISCITNKETIIYPDLHQIVDEKFNLEYDCTYNFRDVYKKIYGTIHSLTFKTKILKDNFEFIKVKEGIFYEDNEYCLYPMVFVKNIFISKFNVYRYLVDQANQSVSKLNSIKRIDNRFVMIDSLISHFDIVKNLKNDFLIDYFSRAIARQIYGIFEIYFSMDKYNKVEKKKLKSFDKRMKTLCKEAYNCAQKYKMIKVLRLIDYNLNIIRLIKR